MTKKETIKQIRDLLGEAAIESAKNAASKQHSSSRGQHLDDCRNATNLFLALDDEAIHEPEQALHDGATDGPRIPTPDEEVYSDGRNLISTQYTRAIP